MNLIRSFFKFYPDKKEDFKLGNFLLGTLYDFSWLILMCFIRIVYNVIKIRAYDATGVTQILAALFFIVIVSSFFEIFIWIFFHFFEKKKAIAITIVFAVCFIIFLPKLKQAINNKIAESRVMLYAAIDFVVQDRSSGESSVGIHGTKIS